MGYGRLLAAVVIAGLAALPAPRLFAHGNEYLVARLAIGNDGEVVLELTADIANPLLSDEAHARTVLASALQIRQGESFKPLEATSPLRFEFRDRYSDDAPMQGATDATPHRLLTAIWRAHLPGQTLVFATPERTPHDVLLWRVPPAGQTPQWKLLISGEQSPEIDVPAPSSAPSARAYWLGGAVMVIAFALTGWQVLRATRATTTS